MERGAWSREQKEEMRIVKRKFFEMLKPAPDFG
jgi:hypothetical protein